MVSEGIRRLPAVSGWRWVTGSMVIFAQEPMRWIALNLMLLFIASLLSMIPLVGTLLFALLTPVFVGGLTLGCRDAAAGRPLLPAYLFAGFRTNAPALVSIGGVYVVGQIAIFGLLNTVGGSDLQALVQAVTSDRPGAGAPTIGDRVLVSVLLAAALFVPLAMAVWFAPVLAVLDAMPASEGLKYSLRACLRNLPAMAVYGVVMSALLLALLFTVRLVVALIPPGLSLMREPVAMVLSTLWIALTLISGYVGYREIFVTGSKA